MAKEPDKPELCGAFKGLPEKYGPFLPQLSALSEKYGLKGDTQFAPDTGRLKCAYYIKKPKKKLFTLWASPYEIRLKANLYGFDGYSGGVLLSEEIKRQMTTNALDCASCERYKCSGVKFTLDGQAYHKCVFGAFTFINLEPGDFITVLGLIEKEMELL